VADLSLRLETIPWVNTGDVFLQPLILLLDEVDIHLHPKWQRLILPAVQKLLPNAQIFASTHSPFVVGSVKDAWIYRLPRP
jgi:predicted ATP-binding protein involved in virulence